MLYYGLGYLAAGCLFSLVVRPYNFPYDHTLNETVRPLLWPFEALAYARNGFKNGYSFVEDVTGEQLP